MTERFYGGHVAARLGKAGFDDHLQSRHMRGPKAEPCHDLGEGVAA